MNVLYLFRHCAVDQTLRSAGRGVLDYPLSPEGTAASRKIVEFLVRHQIDAVLTTGRRRTDFIGQTLEQHGIVHRVERRFQEQHFAPQCAWNEFQHQFPIEAELYGQDADALQFPLGESSEQVRERVVQAWTEWVARDIDRLAIIGHDTSNQWLLAYLKNEEVPPPVPQHLGGLYEIEIDGNDICFSRENVPTEELD